MARTTQVAKVTEADVVEETGAAAREAPVLKSTALQWNADDFVWRTALVRLPDGMILQDLNLPEIWRNIQQTPQKALRVLDRVTCISFDESWVAKDLLVIEADSDRAVLAVRSGDVIRMRSKTGTWQDDRHVIRFSGTGYACYRRADGIEVLPGQFSSLEACKSEMYRTLYTTKRVA